MGYIWLMLTNYFHDLAVALLATNIIVIHLLGRSLKENPERRDILGPIVQKVSRVSWYTLGFVILAGAVRAYFFMDFEWNPLVEKNGMLVALGVKHIFLFGLTIFGVVGMRSCKRSFNTDEG